MGSAEREYLLSLIDDAERIVASDPLAEALAPVAYELRAQEKEERKGGDDFYRMIASCHACQLFASRRVFARPVAKKNPRVLFITENPEGDMLLTPESLTTFRAFWKDSMHLREGEWALTTMIKCPGIWSRDAADACRLYLRKELEDIAPGAIVLMGMNAARYMLGERGADDAYLKHRFTVNHIPLYVTYSPAEYRADRSLRTRIWENLVFIRGDLGAVR